MYVCVEIDAGSVRCVCVCVHLCVWDLVAPPGLECECRLPAALSAGTVGWSVCGGSGRVVARRSRDVSFFHIRQLWRHWKVQLLLSTHAYVSTRIARAPLNGTLRDSPTVRESAWPARPWRQVSDFGRCCMRCLPPHQTRRNYSNLTSSLCRRLDPQPVSISTLPAGSPRIRAWRPWPQRFHSRSRCSPFATAQR